MAGVVKRSKLLELLKKLEVFFFVCSKNESGMDANWAGE
jgi:hypothetical protein